MSLDESTMNTGGNWGVVIFFLILFWVFTGGFCGFGNRCGSPENNVAELTALLQNEGSMGRVKNFDLEKQNAQNTTEITNAIHSLQDNLASTILQSNNQLAQQSRLQYDAQIGSQMFDLKLNNLAKQQSYETQLALQQQNYEAKLASKDATIERMTLANQMTAQINALEKQIAHIGCNMLVKPNITGIGAVCPNSGIINGLGITGGMNCSGIS